MRKLFGTDGIRGIANQDPITPEMGLKLGRAVVQLCTESGAEPFVVIGRDTRISGQMLEHAIVSGVLSAGGDATQVGILPTPAVAYLTKQWNAGGGVVISASHNPYEYNGFKVFTREGYKLSEAVESQTEALMLSPGDLPAAEYSVEPGRSETSRRAFNTYLSFLAETFPAGQALDDLKVVLDCANGATYRVAPALFKRLGARVEVIHADPDGRNINQDCGSEHPEYLSQEVLRTKAHLGLAFDGDGDRLIVVDETGRVLTGDQIMAICAKMLKEKGELAPPIVVSTVMSNLGFRFALEGLGLRHISTRVGDRYVMEAMRAEKARLGGENSGHIIFGLHHTTGDGLLSAVQLVLALKTFAQPLSQLSSLMTPFPQTLINVPVRRKPSVETVPEVFEAIKAVEEKLGERGRVLVRYSGTEPVCRVMVEGEEKERVDRYAREIAEVVGKNLAHSNSSDSSEG
jgi:phosphoglucosamine mutase